MPNKKRIAIVGAGPGGLTLARILLLNGIEASVFEREAHPSVRPQGGSLDMHQESGQYAIQCAGLSDEFQRLARYEDQEGRIYDKHANLLFLDTSNEGDRPEIDRGQLRQMLMDSLPEGVIRWNHEFTNIQPEDEERFEISFKNGVTESFDLVVGADGAWSRIRPLISDARPIYSGVTFFELGFEDADVKYPEIAKLIGHGLTFALGDSKAIIGHRDSNSHVGIYAGLRVPEDWIATGGLDMSSDEAARSSLAAYFEGWSEDLLQTIRRSNQRITPRGIYALPIGHRWDHRAGVTLLGDAAHLMSPFSGEGANLALLDATDLALGLASDRDWDDVVQEFELKMFARAAEAAVEAKAGLDVTFSDAGLANALEHFGRAHE